MSMLSTRVREMFDLPEQSKATDHSMRPIDCVPKPGEILLVTGASGSGKSRMLRAIRKQTPDRQWIDPTMIPIDDRPVIDRICELLNPHAPDTAIERGLELLSRVGLAEAWTYLQSPRELSDGQRWRLILALMLAQASTDKSASCAIIAMDEFAALLDRVTAMIVAKALRRLIDQFQSLSAIVVTSHDDLLMALCPDRVIECDFGEYRNKIRVLHPESPVATAARSIRARP